MALGQDRKNKSTTHNDRNHAWCCFFTGEQSSHEKNDDSDGDSCDSEVKLNVGMVDNHDDELDGEAKEEEKVKL